MRVAFKHVGAYEQAAAALSPEEIAKLPRHMRPASQERARTGRRVESHLRVEVDGRPLLDRRALGALDKCSWLRRIAS